MMASLDNEKEWEELLYPLSFDASPARRVWSGDEVIVDGARRALVRRRMRRNRLIVDMHDGTTVVVGEDAVTLLRTAAEIRRDADLAQVNKSSKVNKKKAPALPRCPNLLMPIDPVEAAAEEVSPVGCWKKTARGWRLCAIASERPQPSPPCLSADELGSFLQALAPELTR